MRFKGLAFAIGAFALVACGGGGEKAADTTAKADTTAAPPATPAPAATGTAAPITGTTHEVKMVGDDKGYRFEPATLTIKAGDGIKFTNVSGGPHNVAFDPATVAAAAKTQLAANMPNPMAELSGPLLTQPNEAYTISFGGIPAGDYEAHCTPHLAMNMKMKITVQ
jgi:plastocyanin